MRLLKIFNAGGYRTGDSGRARRATCGSLAMDYERPRNARTSMITGTDSSTPPATGLSTAKK